LSKTIETYVEVEVDLDEFSDEELLEELERRNIEQGSNVSIEQLYDIWRFDRHKFEDAFRTYCWDTIGRSF
jgi:hypothetical protein